MREILFRGKRVDNGKWTQGYLFCVWEKAYICWGTVNDVPDMKEVDPETVCQYTGLNDRNGRKIFEGDIVRVKFKEVKIGAKEDFYNYNVKYDEYRAEFGLFGNEELYGRAVFEERNQPIMEVIGNIFDNPELLSS